jgi:hypothetical protein
LSLDHTGFPDRKLYTTVTNFTNFPHKVSVSSNALRIVTTERLNDDFGPDLAFIVLPPSEMRSELIARKSFYNLTFKPSEKKARALTNLGLVPFCGYPRTADFSGPRTLGFRETHGLFGFIFFTAPEKYEERSGWDYYELAVERGEIEKLRYTFGGVSGGGIWRIPILREAGKPQGTEVLGETTFAGVAFLEEDRQDVPRFFVRAHGPASIYDAFVPMVRDQLR